MQSLARTGPRTPKLPAPLGLSAVTDPRRVASVPFAGHFRRCEAGCDTE